MKKKFSIRALIFRLIAVAILVVIAAVMMRIGRGHTIYFDNKTLELENGEVYEAVHKVTVNTPAGEKLAKLGKRERGMDTCIGQKYTVEFVINKEKGDDDDVRVYHFDLPYGMDNIMLNLPALFADQPEEIYLSEFIPAVEEEPAEEEAIPGEDMDVSLDF